MEVLALLKAAWALLRARPWIALVAIILAQAAAVHVLSGQRADLREWRDEVTQATRDAADKPKLAQRHVAQQIRFLGEGLTKVREAMATARANALTAKHAKEAADEANRKEFDDALQSELAKALRDGDRYARGPGLQCDAGSPAAKGGSDNAGADLSGTGPAAGIADRSGSGPALVSIPREAFDTCTALKVRLDNGHAWALEQVK